LLLLFTDLLTFQQLLFSFLFFKVIFVHQ